MRHLFLTLFIALTCIGCKTAPINQKENNKRVGLWIEEYAMDSTEYKSVGKYKNGDPVKKWSYYTNNKIYKKEVYRKNKSTITYYNANGTFQSKGKAKLIITEAKLYHWFYYGDWKYFDENGNLISIKKYENGKIVSDIKTPILAKGKIKHN